MDYLAAALLVLVNTAALLLTLIGLPGNWVMVLAAGAVAWWRAGMLGWPVLAAVLLLALTGEILEFAAGLWGAKAAGGTRGGAVGALVGGLAGGLAGTLLPAPLIGTLVGACGGAAIGALLLELRGGRTLSDSLRAGTGAGIGRFTGTVAKLFAGIAIWIVTAVAAFWP